MKPTGIISLFLALLLCAGFLIGCASTATTPEKASPEARALRRLGEAYWEQGDYSSALKYFLEAEKQAPRDHLLQYNLGLTYMEKKQYNKAISHFKKALELNPNYSPARNSLGNAYIYTGEYDNAVEVLSQLIGSDAYIIYATPQIPKANLALAYFYKKEYALAETNYLEALKHYEGGFPKDKTYLSALRGLGLTYLAMDRPEEAIVQIEKAIDTAPNVQVLYLDLARAFSATGQRSQAAEAYQMAIDLNPTSDTAAEAKSELQFLR
jgi:tetratricopeptide (TPR) repeat protein